MLVGAILAVIPDLDLVFSWILGYSIRTHGDFTHSILFSVGTGVLACWLMRERNLRGYLMFPLAGVSHGILDFVTRKEFGGAALLWPFSSHKYRLGWFNYFEFYPNPATEPIRLILRNAWEVCRYELAIFLPVFLIVVCIKRWQDMRQTQPMAKAARRF
jgi:membrane-bound metal-dependent hydrolase YbcI (DUF457 family)